MGVGYMSKVTCDYAFCQLTGQGYAQDPDLNHFAYGAGVFYLVNAVSKTIFDNWFGEEREAISSIAIGIIAVPLTAAAMISFKATPDVEYSFITY